MNNPKRYTITAALPYANGGVHLGHLAGAYLPADIYARYRRLRKDDVIYICGSDEHGVPITLGARKEGITPQQFVDKYHALMKKSFEGFGISFDIYSRTSNRVHHETASQFFLDLYKDGKFTEETSLQYYDEQEKMFLADRYIKGTCPVCGNENAYGDQCEKCGSSLSPKDLRNPVSVLSGQPPVQRETRHWYFPLNEYEEWLREWILVSHKDDWKVNVYGQCKSWIDAGLQPRAMTRDLDWGVKVPLPGTEGKVLYVWFDAPIGYISATKELLPDTWEKYWKDKDTKLIHFIGKDNIVFHCIIFPSLLHAHGEYIVPDNVPANEFLNLEGEKLSTSRNWAVWLHEYLEDFPGRQDVLRYVLTAAAPETKDNDFTWKDFQARNNSELVAIWGNFVNRTLVLTAKYFDNKVPALHEELFDEGERELMYKISITKNNVAESLEHYRFREALAECMNLVRAGNKYLTDKEPWKIHATDPAKTAHILNIGLQLIGNIALLMKPFLPHASSRTFAMLNLNEEKLSWDDIGNTKMLTEQHPLNQAELLFARIEDDVITQQVEKLHAKKIVTVENVKDAAATLVGTKAGSAEPKPEITYDDFSRLDLRIGIIEAAEKVKKADKLLQLKVNLGSEMRTIVSGIASFYAPEDIIGQSVCVVTNLAPRKIKGIESRGMILMAEDENGRLRFMMPSEKTSAGSIVS